MCRRLMTTPGVGPVVALTYRATVDVPARFRKSKAVGEVFGLTCSKYQSGEIDRNGRISRCGDEMMRVMLYEAAQSMLWSKKWSWLKAWAMQIARRRGMKNAIVALARRLAVIMDRTSSSGRKTVSRMLHESGKQVVGLNGSRAMSSASLFSSSARALLPFAAGALVASGVRPSRRRLRDQEKPKLDAADGWLPKHRRVDRGHHRPSGGRD